MNISFADYGKVRQQLYEKLPARSDALFNTLDSLCGRQYAQSAVELTLEEPFKRKYCSLFDAVDQFFISNSKDDFSERQRNTMERLAIIAPFFPATQDHPFLLTAVDATPALRPHAKKLADRSIVHAPNPAPANKPIGVGHQYSALVLLPERERQDSPWVVPISSVRIPTDKTANQIASMQMATLLQVDE